MFKQYREYREMQQLRKDHLKKQKLRYGLIFFAIAITLLLAMAVVEGITPAEPAKSASTQYQETPQETQDRQERQEIEEFALAVTKPLHTLTREDLDLVGAKAKDPCYEKNATLPQEEMVEAIATCKNLN
jgi:hypothetical protein